MAPPKKHLLPANVRNVRVTDRELLKLNMLRRNKGLKEITLKKKKDQEAFDAARESASALFESRMKWRIDNPDKKHMDFGWSAKAAKVKAAALKPEEATLQH